MLILIDTWLEMWKTNLKLPKKITNFTESYSNATLQNWPKFYRNLKNSWTVPLQIVNLLILIDNKLGNRKNGLKLLIFCDFYLKFWKIWKISEYKIQIFSEIIRNFAKRYYSKLTEILPKFRKTDFEFRCKSLWHSNYKYLYPTYW